MGLTPLSFILLPLCVLWFAKPLRLLQLTVIASIFEAAAVVSIGGLGVQPGLAPAAIFLGFIALQLLLGAGYPHTQKTWVLVRPFAVFTLWAIVSSIVMPRLFEGQIYVLPQKSEMFVAWTLLAPNAGNINQDIYLFLNCVFLVLAPMFINKQSVDLRSLVTIYLFSGYLVAAIALWQLANKLAGIPYPESFFYSNPGWAILNTQQVGLIPRINGPFSEPSSLAGYMAAVVCGCGWTLIQGHRAPIVRPLLIIGLLTILLSTSTTGYVVLAVVTCGVPVYGIFTGSARLMKGYVGAVAPLLLVAGFVVATASVVKPDLLDKAQEVINSTLDKPESSSYKDRSSANTISLDVFEDSWGLGVGWGSNRSSSLIPGLLANTGLPGIAAIVWFVFTLTRNVKEARRFAPRHDLFVIDTCCGALVGYLISALVAGPSINSMTFYLLVALLIGGVVRVQVAERRLRTVRLATYSAATASAARDGQKPSRL